MADPKVSVLIPTYNHARFVRETLDSALAQTYSNYEVVVSDDGSTDGTPDVAQEYARAHPDRVTVLRSERNTGIAANFNRALAARSGEFYAWLGGDDVMLPERLERQVGALASRADAVACVSDAEVFDSDSGRVLGRFSEMYNGMRGFPDGGIELWLRPAFHMLPSTMLVRSAAAPAAGYDERLSFSNELVFDVEVFLQGRCIGLDDPLVRYRRHGANVTTSRLVHDTGLEEGLMAMAIIAARHPELTPHLRRRRASLLLSEAASRRARGDRAGAGRYAVAALRDSGPLTALSAAWAHLRVARGRRRLGAATP